MMNINLCTSMKTTRLWSGTLIGVLSALLATALDAGQPEMSAHFINVDQANAALLEFPCGASLIDAGAENPDYREFLRQRAGNAGISPLE